MLWCFLLTKSFVLFGQINVIQSFEVETWYDNHVTVSPNNEIYLASEMKFPLNNYERGSYIVKYDSCNTIQWKKIYQKTNLSLNVQDLEAMENGDILLMGITSQKDVFLIRLNAAGEEIFSKTYSYTTHNFNYTLSSRNNEIMIFGNSFSTGSSTFNYILVLDEMGEIIWSKNYLDSVVAGKALFCSDSGFLCHSGNILYKTDPSGNLVWAKRYPFIDQYNGQISNLVEGDFQSYYFSFYDQSNHHLLKIAPNGEPEWMSEGVKAQGAPGNLLAYSDGFYWVNILEDAGKLVPIIVEYDDLGNIMGQFKIDHPNLENLNLPSAIYLPNDQTIALFATQESQPFQDTYIRTTLEGLCYLTEYTDAHSPAFNPNYLIIDFDPVPANFTSTPILNLNVTSLDFADKVLCKQLAVSENYTVDSLLECGESYFFQSPYPQFTHQWTDGYEGTNREIDFPGLYELYINECQDAIFFQIAIEKEACDCETVFPNAFTPNQDGINDDFKVIGDCDFLEYELVIYDRWGNLVFQSLNPKLGWDGTIQGKTALEEVFIYKCRYLPDNGIGTGQETLLRGEVQLIR